MDDGVEVVVVGAGVVGLAVARALALAGREVCVLEAGPTFGVHASSRNSEVIHAGIYYPPGSLKARLCVRGRDALYRYCEARELPHRRLGKLLVACSEGERSGLEQYARRAEQNGVTDLVALEPREVRALEPAVQCLAALFSPSTGIVDSHALMDALARDAKAHGASIVFRTPVLRGRVGDDFALALGDEAASEVRCRRLVNAAGLFAQSLSRSLAGLDPCTIPPCHYAKGHYFALAGPSPFRHLVYPMPSADGLGVHLTLDLDQRARFGPDVSWVERVDYSFEEERLLTFERAIRRYYPALQPGSLAPGYTGIRPKLGPEGTSSDFVIQGPREHGVPGLVNLYGIESPGLTAALAIADEVASSLDEPARA